MNAKIERQYDIVKLYRQLRDDLTAELTNEDLAYSPGGENAPLGVLCREMGETQKGYIESFKTFEAVFDYKAEDVSLETSIQAIRSWYASLDEEMDAVLEGLTDEDVDNRLVFRNEEFKLPPVIHLDVFREALLIFYGKVSTYLKAMGKSRPTKWDRWLG